MNLAILSKEVLAYLQAKRATDPAALALAASPFDKVSPSELARQLDGYQRASKKIPALVAHAALYYPDKLNLEQSSSTETGLFKASLIKPNKSLIDLTGGFGIDSYYFATISKQVTHCELNSSLSEIVQHNFESLGVKNVDFHSGDGIAYLAASQKDYDYCFIDPSRRVKAQKVFRLEDCEPNLVAEQDLLLRKAPVIISKLAPLLDISLALKSLKHVRDVNVISMQHDCKELLFIQERGFSGEPKIHAVQLHKEASAKVFSFSMEAERIATPNYSEPLDYLYEPDVALSKAGAFKSIATRFDLHKIQQHTHLYTSVKLVESFIGKVFKITAVQALSYFKKHNKIAKANIISKNFPLKVDEIRKKYKLKDGGANYLFFCTQADDTLIVIQAERIA